MTPSIVTPRDENQVYQALLNAGYPEDRIARKYQIGDYNVAFAILSPGLAQEPMAVIEVKSILRTELQWLYDSNIEKLAGEYTFPVYIYLSTTNRVLDVRTKTECPFPRYDALKEKWLEHRALISNLELKNFMAFESATFQFGSKLNVLIGENGSGKTQLLRLLYSIARSLVYVPEEKSVKADFSQFKISEIFRAKKAGEFITFPKTEAHVKFNLAGQKKQEVFSIKDESFVLPDSASLKTMFSTRYNKETAVFLPTHELLSIFPGFYSLEQIYKGKWAYDLTYSDCMAYLGLPVIKSQELFSSTIIKEIEKAIHGHIYLNEQGTRFLMQMAKSKAIYEIPMVAEGWKKLGQLLQLMNTGAIHPGSILLWDEPEANLNPQLIRLLAEAIVLLAKMDIQIFVTTHSLFFLREVNMLTKSKKNFIAKLEKGDIRYFNLLGKGKVEQGDDEIELGNVLLLEESLKQSDRYLLEDF